MGSLLSRCILQLEEKMALGRLKCRWQNIKTCHQKLEYEIYLWFLLVDFVNSVVTNVQYLDYNWATIDFSRNISLHRVICLHFRNGHFIERSGLWTGTYGFLFEVLVRVGWCETRTYRNLQRCVYFFLHTK